MSDPTHTRAHPPAEYAPTTTFAPGDLTVAPPDHAYPSDLALPPDGYADLTEIGHGGMGVVYRARELMFDRPVAVKVLHPRYAPDSDTAGRFVDEARITAQLQHPGIPPVHRVGTLSDGRPFLAMKLIDGRTLADLLAARPDATHDRGRWLAVFEGVCQAVGYAHAHGVVHRDLKPHNVMVGAFAEVQVMDWGLAKHLASRDREGAGDSDSDSDPAPSRSRLDADHTQAGSILGTPAYMAPEQARGEAADARADVYALGCTLCELLTGATPHTGTSGSVRELLARVASGDVSEAFARLDASGADADLVALAKRCLAADPAARPADARELATALADHRSGVEKRLREAEVERARADEQLHRRRLRKRFLVGIAALLLLVQGLAWWVYETTERNRDLKTWAEIQKMQPVTAALAEVKALREQGLAQTDDPAKWRQTLDRARTAFKPVEEVLSQGYTIENNPQPELLARDEADCALLLELDRLPELNEIALFAGVPGTRTGSDRYAAAFRKVGFDLTALTDEQAVAWLRNHRFRERLTLALRDWAQGMPPDAQPSTADAGGGRDELGTLVWIAAAHRPPPPETRQDRLRRLADAVSDPFTREWWQAVQAQTGGQPLSKLVKRKELTALSSRQLASLAAGLAVWPTKPDPQFQFDFLQAAYGRFPAEFWVNYRLAKFYQDQPKWQVPFGTPKDEALRHLTAAVAARPASAFPRVMLALHLVLTGREVATAETHLKNAIAVDPTSAWPHLVLASMYAGGGSPPAAIDSYMAGIRADPDTGFNLINAFLVPLRTFGGSGSKEAVYDRLVVEFPDRCESWLLRSSHRSLSADYRGQLADLRESDRRMPADHPQRVLVNTALGNLNKLAVWEERLPELLAGGPLPEPHEWADAARYCAKFDRNYAWAAELADRGLTATNDPFGRVLLLVAEFADWAMRASDLPGLAEAERRRFRTMALRWLVACAERQDRPFDSKQWNAFVQTNPLLRRYTAPAQLRQQPADEQALWARFVEKAGHGKRREVLPVPRRE